MKIERTHSFPGDEAQQRILALTEYWGSKYGIKSEWTGGSARIKGRVKGISFDAKVDVGATKITCEADVGFLAERLGARSYIEKKLDEYLAPATALPALARK